MTLSQHYSMRLCLSMAGLLLSASVLAAGAANSDLEAQYQHDKMACTNGQSNQDRATCLREAGAAYQQAKQGKLNNGPTTPYGKNALERCKALPAQDQADCRRRIDNPSDIEGSVQSGGILRKDVTIIPAAAP
jgi:hypothetical protein